MKPRNVFAIDIPKDLLEKAQAGEHAAFESLYRQFEIPAYTLCLRITGNRGHAQDAVQEAMMRMVDRISEFRGDAPFWSWLRQILVNQCLMLLRKNRQSECLGEEHDPLDNLVSDELMPAQQADARILIDALDRLPALTRAVIWLYHVEGLTHDEIGRQMNKTPSFSKSQLARGTKRLRQLLNVTEVNHA